MSDERPQAPNAPILLVELDYPIAAYGEEVKAVPFYRRITAGDVEWAQDEGHRGVKGLRMMLNRLTLLPMASLKALDATDLGALEDTIEGFMTRSPKTGLGDSQS